MKKAYFLLIPLALVFAIGAFFSKSVKFNQKLPYYGEIKFDSALLDGKYKKDTIFHTIPDFKLTDQEGKEVTQANFQNKIYITDFFFTSCKSICPVMSNNMEKIVAQYKNSANVLFISHTVNPAFDSVAVMNEYAKLHHAEPGKWYFVTGDKKQLYDLARNAYLLSATEGNGGAGDFVHTQNFALIDKEKRIRGVYDGTDSIEAKKLITDIALLLDEYNN
jgi:protein SCO1